MTLPYRISSFNSAFWEEKEKAPPKKRAAVGEKKVKEAEKPKPKVEAKKGEKRESKTQVKAGAQKAEKPKVKALAKKRTTAKVAAKDKKQP